jgi:hypothetical protein
MVDSSKLDFTLKIVSFFDSEESIAKNLCLHLLRLNLEKLFLAIEYLSLFKI